MDHHDLPFYDKEIVRRQEQEYINEILRKYRHEKADEELKKRIYEELMMEKYYGRISIPFKVVLRQGEKDIYPTHVEILLDTKV